MQRFLKMLHMKIAAKAALFPDKINDNDFTAIKNFKQFDDRYTAPIHGFSGAEDYWTQCSTTQFLTAITVPTLIVNALDDPFLTDKCFYLKEAERNCNVFLETPKSGGHVGFVTFGKSGEYWSETRAAEFCNGHLTVYETWKKYP